MSIKFADVEQAAENLKPYILTTPLLENESINEHLGFRLLVKAECLQKTGSFKFRGATNFLSNMTDVDKALGIVAFSSGNHAQGVALAARLFGVSARIVMPEDAPLMKIKNTERHGAEVILYDRYKESREEIAANLAAETGAILIPPFDHPFIMAGQGTVGLEASAQAEERGVNIDDFVVCISGGGLSAGCALALAEKSPSTALWVAEPQGFDDAKRSLDAGYHVHNKGDVKSICDALLLPSPGELTFPILLEKNVKGLTVTDEDVLRAMHVAFSEYKLVLEPGGAVALAAILSGKLLNPGKTVCVVCTGGNVDPEIFQRALAT